MSEKLSEWLNKTFLMRVLQGEESKEQQIEVRSFSVSSAVGPGENFLSHLYRIKGTYKNEVSEEQSISLIVKVPLTKGVMVEMSERLNLFVSEPQVYKYLLPKFNKKLNCEFGPKSFFCPMKGLVLKDLKEDGYEMCNKYKQLDFPHCEQALKCLAKFHAASVICYNEDPIQIKEVAVERMFVKGAPFLQELKPAVEASVKIVAEMIGQMDGCKQLAEFFLSRAAHITDSSVDICKPKEKGLNVLNHGDFWSNNILFKYNDKGNVVDVKLLDFQFIRFASPALDINYFIWCSANDEVREHRLTDLIEVYLHTLNSTLEELDCQERMTMEELKEDFKRAVDLAIMTICYALPISQSEVADAVNLEGLEKEDLENYNKKEFLKRYEGKHYKALLPKLVKQFSKWIFS